MASVEGVVVMRCAALGAASAGWGRRGSNSPHGERLETKKKICQKRS